MTSRCSTIAFQGVEGVVVDCQAQFVGGQPNIIVVGLPDKAVGESRERVRAALHAIGLALPGKTAGGQSVASGFAQGGQPL